MSERKEFDQLPKERSKAFAAFRLYLELGPERTIDKVAKSMSRSRQYTQKWATKYDWDHRARAFDAHFNEIERKAIEKHALGQALSFHIKAQPALPRIAKPDARARECVVEV